MALMALGLTGCQTSYDAPEFETPVATMKPNTTIAELKKLIYDNIADPEDDMLFRLGQNPETGEDYIIHGRVITSDASGNIYQQIVLQDETAAIAVPIRQNSIWTSYRVGQEVVLNVTDLYLGTNASYYEIGWLDDYIGEESLGYLSWLRFLEHSEKNGVPNQNIKFVPMDSEWPSDSPYGLITTIDRIINLSAYSEEGYKAMSQYVELQNVHFVDAGKDTYAQYQESNEYRFIEDAYGNKIPLNNSGYSTFHNEMLPEGEGTIRAILSYYQFSDYDNKWQLTLIDSEDVIFDTHGNSKNDPYTVEEALAQNNNGRTGWTEGYIVGSIKGGLDPAVVTSNNDIIFGAEGDSPESVLIAQNPNETDWTKCIAVQLPRNSLFRSYVNLVENAYLIGKKLTVRGTFSPYYGMHGIVDNGGGLNEFSIEGIDFSEGMGTGAEDSPYTVEYVVTNPSPVNDVWVEGYVVGFINGSDFSSDAVFGLPDSSSNYNGANVIISTVASGATIANSIPVRTANRNEQGLNNNPDLLGKKVKILGNLDTYLGGFGLSKTSTWIIE